MLFRKRHANPVAARYAAIRPCKANVPEREVSFCVIDMETSGFNLHQDRILSIAVAIIRDGVFRMDSLRSIYVYQEHASVTEASSVHGILPSQTNQGVAERVMLSEILPSIENSVLVGHHVGFDAAMLDRALMRHFNISLKNTLLDTAVLSMHELDAFKKTGYINQKPPTLDEVCSQLGIPMVERHTASGDVFTTAQLFLLLRARMQQRLGDGFLLKHYPISRL
jgi:DNA polymerase III subunit epsilon